MSNVNFNAGKVGTDNLGTQRGTVKLDAGALNQLTATLPIADKMKLAGGGASTMPEIFAKLTPRDQAALLDLPAPIRNQVLADVSSDVDTARYVITSRLVKLASALVPGAGLSFEPAKAWRLSDAAIAYSVLGDLSPAEAKRLEGVSLKRVNSTLLADKTRESDGKAALTLDAGHATATVGMLKRTGFRVSAFLERHAITHAIGTYLGHWFPHPAQRAEVDRTILLGDAQVTRMREVLCHEVGHQVQFGPNTDLGEIREWAKLSGWKNADGTPSNGLDASGNLLDMDPSVRPSRQDNFVYDTFAGELTPDKLQAAMAEIADPELKREFATTAKVQNNIRGAVKEVFGVDARGYSMTSPLEDYAESFRAFHQDTELLVAKAPDKFLYLNAQSGRYTADQVQVFFQRANKDPRKVATDLVANTALNQDTVNRLFKVNGLSADVQALGASARKQLAAGNVSDPFRAAFLLVQEKVAAKDLGFIGTFTQDAAKALGAGWAKLTPAQQAQFATVEKRQAMVQKMQVGLASAATLSNQGHTDIQDQALRDLAAILLKNPTGPWQVPPTVVAALPPAAARAVRQNPKQIEAFVKEFQRLYGGNAVDDGKIDALVGGLNPANLEAAFGQVAKDPKAAAQVLMNWITGDPNAPP
ncbi:MAG: hypothetical protein JWM80_1931 [Cyanobacteria bacterium RYN_339]|nr:hypothetical protein [Cyanobacteria bacterium RYN_339]